VRSNGEAWKRLAEPNGTPAMDRGFEDVRKCLLVFGLLCRHTASNPITAGTQTSGAL